ncbi:uncharacterized protein LOC117299515 isoform X2 [Asterias rubens]|uniref:uncharacterized protein LOC117299515 isoform X1 n=1 Tax=Asterias rubens TaxID=7604 RepID=UPI0014551C13|nr:uncharacterized protein LOC117299515 isoform X1 [Asterias rubens]XP_033639060.1 uncharacterized protein LOC117299515 isoform X2 [Asterias rubens]
MSPLNVGHVDGVETESVSTSDVTSYSGGSSQPASCTRDVFLIRQQSHVMMTTSPDQSIMLSIFKYIFPSTSRSPRPANDEGASLSNQRRVHNKIAFIIYPSRMKLCKNCAECMFLLLFKDTRHYW